MAKDDDLEEARKDIYRRAEEERKKLEAEEDARRLEAEGRRAAEDAQRITRENIEFLKKSFKEIQEEHKAMMSKMTEESSSDFTRKWGQTMSRVADMTTMMLTEAIGRSIRNSLDTTNVGDLQPGFGRVGQRAAQFMGEAFGTALGTMITGNPVTGRIIGKIVGAVSDFTVGAVQMQAEGYSMLGAKVAPMAAGPGGTTSPQDFARIGREYRTAVMEIVRDTGAASEVVGQTANALSKIGVGFLDAGKGETQFAIAADRMLNLQPNTTLKLQTDIVTKYGESLLFARQATYDLAEGVMDFTIAQKEQRNAIAGTFAAGQTLSDALGQISSQARNSGASLEATNSIAMSLIKTMATGSGAGMMRPEQIVTSGGNLAAGLLPSAQSNLSAEARRSGIDQMLLNRTDAGRALRGRIMAQGDALGMSQKDRTLYFETLSTMHLSNPSTGPSDAKKLFAAQLAGINSMIEEAGGSMAPVQSLLGDRLGSMDMVMARQMFGDLRKRGAFEPGADAAKVMQSMLRERESDPRYKETVKHFKDILGNADDQGDAMRSRLDKISDTLTSLSTFFNDTYWTKATEAMTGVFHPKSGDLASLSGASDPMMAAYGPGAAASARGSAPPAAPAAPQTRVTRNEATMSDAQMSAMRDQDTRTQSGLEVH